MVAAVKVYPRTPFGDWDAPTAQACRAVVQKLSALHGEVRRPTLRAANTETAGCGGVPTIVEALVRTILSQNTTNKNSSRAMAQLLDDFDHDYAAICAARPSAVAQSIRSGGLANVKAQRIVTILQQVQAEQGKVSLEHLRGWPDHAIKEYLLRYDGVGPKTASCVLLFCLGRDSFAVDTHIFRICKKLGWVPANASREQAHAHLDERVPKGLQYALHVLLIRHGKSCYACAAHGRPQQPPRGPCPL